VAVLITVEATARFKRASPARERSKVTRIIPAVTLRRRVEKLLANLKASDPTQYRILMQRSNYTSDLVQLAVAQTVRSQPMLGIIELRGNGAGNGLTVRTIICPDSCKQSTGLFYLGILGAHQAVRRDLKRPSKRRLGSFD